ncbi:hypothetical protein [Bdellovibrio svalbardensis]|uniref:Uncharacterized protein n=1 Tax=Bdellovibrio svalbardensis TaxID=2972972 RepID=A0ABT6DMK5_9BACT|nr:hypothetical protein [Bdellovibrio svalbardensis]MDG0817881.1 hypothetical protein [Bdellovibrio svalbardensis]
MKLTTSLLVVLFLQSTTSYAGILGSSEKWSANDAEVVSRLTESFGPGCSLTGGSASDALSVVRSLGDVMTAASNAPECRSLVGVVSTLQASHLQASSIWPAGNEDSYNESMKNLLKYKKQKEEILLLLATETDAASRADLKSQLQSIQVELAGAEGEKLASLERDRTYRKNEAIRTLVTATNLALEQALANQTCWGNKPDLLQQIVGMGSAVGYSAAMVSPASTVALGMGAGLQMIGGVLDFFKRAADRNKVSAFTQAMNPIALTCALEKMNQIYCAAKDTQNTLDVIAKAGATLKQDQVWGGIRLARRELPTFIDWLERLRSGAGNVSSPEDADKIEQFEIKRQLLQQTPRRLTGYLGKYRPLFSQASSVPVRFGILKDFIADLSSSFCYDNPNAHNSNPLCVIYSPDYVPFYLLGIDRSRYLQLRSTYQGLTFSQIDLSLLEKEGINVDINIDSVQPKFNAWYDIAKQRFDTEAASVLGEDLRLVFEEALAKTGGDKLRLSPYTALQRIIDFLRLPSVMKFAPDFKNEIVQELSSVLDNMKAVEQGQLSPQEARNNIFTSAHLSSGTQYLQNRAQFALRQQLENLLMERGDLPLQALAANDYVQELYSYYGSDSLEILRRKSLSAQATIQRSIDPFINFFATPLQMTLQDLDNAIKRYGEGPGGANYEMKFTLCFYLLGSSRWTSDLDLTPCTGVYGRPIFQEGRPTPAFSKELFKLPYQDRACILRDYVRRNQILQSKLGLQRKRQSN